MAEEADRIVNQTMQVINPTATLVVGVLDALLKNRKLVQKMAIMLEEAQMRNKELEAELAKQCKEVKNFEDQKTEELIKIGMSPEEAGQQARESADKFWIQEYGDSITFITVNNKDAFDFERELSAGKVPFAMMPIHMNDFSSIYMALGRDAEKIKAISQEFESRSFIMDKDAANDLMAHTFVRKIENLSFNEAMYLSSELSKENIHSRIAHKENGYSLLIPEREISGREDILNKSLCVASIENTSPIQKRINLLDEMRMAPVQTMLDLQKGIEKDNLTIVDSAHPENYMVLRKGGAIVYQNQSIVGELDLREPADMKEMERVMGNYVFPIQTEKNIDSLSSKEIGQSYMMMSAMEQEKGRFLEYLKYLDRESRIQMKLGVDVDNHPVLYTNDLESVNTFMNHEDNADFIDNIAEACEARALDNKDSIGLVMDDSILTESVINQAKDNIVKLQVHTEMYEPEAAIDIEDIQEALEEQSREFGELLPKTKEDIDDIDID